MSDLSYSAPHEVEARRRQVMLAGAVGLVLCALGLLVDREQFFRSYLVGYMFWLGIALGSMALCMVHHMSGGAWGLVIRRIFEASSRTLPVLALLFIPIALGMHDLYPWTHADHVQHNEVLQHKSLYLNIPFFLARAMFYFAVWIVLARQLNRWSLEQDLGDVVRSTRRMQLLSGGGLVLYGLTITFASVDWVMSLNPHWYSTIFGFIFMGSQGLAALAFTIAVAVMLSRSEPMAHVYRADHFHDLGKLLLAFVMLWAYFNFSQYLIIYSGNLVEEIPYYVARTRGGWGIVALILVVFHFALPFALLLSRDLKRSGSRLMAVALGILVIRVVDLFFLVAPEFETQGFSIHWLDIAAPIGLGGLWLWLFLTQLRQRPLLPLRDPHLAEALEGAGGH
ncbi:MAG TPA: hypothetical protein VGQ10_03820 [Vicinamibacterales bacterium]|jgi:hypothetical protein|nr:hypothetical protein [Vicinamibacterales bacterium]